LCRGKSKGKKPSTILFHQCGQEHFDMGVYEAYLIGALPNHKSEELTASLNKLEILRIT
jgi:hypothetical protein